MTDSMNFGPEWIRNLPSEGSTGGGTTAATRYQLADYRYGREEMLVLFDKHIKPPASLTNFKSLYSESTLLPLALTSPTDEDRGWQGRPAGVAGSNRGRGGSLERGRISRGRGGYQLYGRPAGYDSGWGNGEQSEWSPRKEYSSRTMSMENWRRGRTSEEEDGWRSNTASRGMSEKWGRSTSWRGEGDSEERSGPPERGGRQSWHDVNRGPPSRRSWENEDHLPEWATENPIERRGTFDERGAFHGSDDEQLEGKSPNKREMGLQKSVSQQHIINKSQHSQLSSSKSTMSLIKMDEYKSKEDNEKIGGDEIESSKESGSLIEQNMPPILKMPERLEKEVTLIEKPKSDEGLPVSSKINDKFNSNGPVLETITNREEEDFERLQEDLVQKLMVDEEPLKQTPTTNSFDVNSVQPPPNLAPPVQDKWFYQDPQGQMQGPFVNLEMAEWYKAGYFSNQLKVRRQCDDRFFLLGDLITMSGGANPFQSGVRYPAMKNDVSKVSDQELFQMQYYSQMAAFKQAQARVLAEPWSPLNLQQQELSAQRLILQQQQQVPQDLQFLQQPPPPTNPLMHIVNQMQQNSKLPVPGIVEKPGASMPNSLDPHLQMHMGAILMPNRLATGSLPNHLPGGLPGNLPANLPPEGLSSSLPSLQPTNALSTGLPISTMQNNLPAGLNSAMNLPRPTSHGSVDQLSQNNPVSNPIISLLKQLQQQKEQTQKMDSFWQQNFINSNPAPPHPPNWQSQQQDVPLSLWDVQQQQQISAISPGTQSDSVQIVSSPEKHSGKIEKDKQSDMQRSKEDHLATIVTTKDAKKKKELDEKQTKKEAEEKRKQEQRKLEADKRIAEEKRKKDEERVRKELEKVKKEAEDKRLKELEEKRRLKEQRRQEEEAKRKSEETRKTEEERVKRESKEQEERRQAEEKKIAQEQLRIAKAAPWSQSGTGLGMSLADIQKSEREKRAQDAALQLQRQQLQEQQQQQQHQEKPTGIQLSWAKKPVEPRKVKSLAQIQAEEQERLAKQAAEARLQKEKEQPPVINTGNIWSSQSLTWVNIATSNAASQWSTSNTTGGFWDESSQKQIPKPSTVSKSNSTNAISSNVPAVAKQPSQKQVKGKTKKEETSASTVSSSATVKTNHNNNNNGPSQDEFTNWCYKTLGNISTNVDIPTFVTFLRDIESAFDIKEYCKEYLGDSTATQQFATNFVEKRRSYKSKNNAHKDDMCSPAPVTPYLQHSSEFQEVKGKNKKNKKSKMLKVDSRILGFNVTSAPDRINVGDRDYGDNS